MLHVGYTRSGCWYTKLITNDVSYNQMEMRVLSVQHQKKGFVFYLRHRMRMERRGEGRGGDGRGGEELFLSAYESLYIFSQNKFHRTQYNVNGSRIATQQVLTQVWQNCFTLSRNSIKEQETKDEKTSLSLFIEHCYSSISVFLASVLCNTIQNM